MKPNDSNQNEQVTPSLSKSKLVRLKSVRDIFVVLFVVSVYIIIMSVFYIIDLLDAHKKEISIFEIDNKTKIEMITLQADNHAKDIDDVTKNLTDKYEKEITITQTKLTALEAKMQSIKTIDDLIIRDIGLYIKARYRRVPKIVAESISEIIVQTCNKEDVSPALIVGIMEIESQFNPMARNEKSGAIGLMQIMKEWVPKMNIKSVYDLYDIPVNIECGVKILKIHIEEDGKGDVSKGLYHYVGKDNSYADQVFRAVGKFVVFRSTVDDDNKTIKEENEKEETQKDVVEPAKTAN